MRFFQHAAIAAALFAAAPALRAQGALSTQGFGYPGGELSTRALGSGGSLADFDANSPINPAGLLAGTRASVYLQYDPEFRRVTGPGLDATTVTARFPLFLISGRFGKARLSLSYASFLDRTWTNTYKDSQTIGTARVPSNVTAISTGGIADVRAAISYSLSPRFTVGVGLHEFPGGNHILFGRSFPADSLSFGSFEQSSSYNFSGSAVSFGVLATPIDHFNFGASGRVGFTMRAHSGDSATIAEARVPNRFSFSASYDGITGTILSVRYGTEQWSAMKGLGSAGLSVFDATEIAGGLETGGPRVAGVPMAVRLGYRARQLPFGVGPQQVSEKQITGGVGIPLSQGRAALDLTLAHARRSAVSVGMSETGWIFSLGIAIKPY